MTPQNVPVNAYETPGAFVIVAPFPAVTEGDVTVELSADGVRFSAALRSAGPRSTRFTSGSTAATSASSRRRPASAPASRPHSPTVSSSYAC